MRPQPTGLSCLQGSLTRRFRDPAPRIRARRCLPRRATRSSGLLAVGRAEREGFGESGLLEYAVHGRRPASQLELDSSSLCLRMESHDHSHAGRVDEVKPVEIEVNSSQAGRLECPLEYGLDSEGRLHVEIAGKRGDHSVTARGQLDGCRFASRHVACDARVGRVASVQPRRDTEAQPRRQRFRAVTPGAGWPWTT
jgi:hypothetical protein